jgi:hypothetical protein
VLQGLADDLLSDERNRAYERMRLRVLARRDDTLITDWD